MTTKEIFAQAKSEVNEFLKKGLNINAKIDSLHFQEEAHYAQAIRLVRYGKIHNQKVIDFYYDRACIEHIMADMLTKYI